MNTVYTLYTWLVQLLMCQPTVQETQIRFPAWPTIRVLTWGVVDFSLPSDNCIFSDKAISVGQISRQPKNSSKRAGMWFWCCNFKEYGWTNCYQVDVMCDLKSSKIGGRGRGVQQIYHLLIWVGVIVHLCCDGCRGKHHGWIQSRSICVDEWSGPRKDATGCRAPWCHAICHWYYVSLRTSKKCFWPEDRRIPSEFHLNCTFSVFCISYR